VSLIVVPTDSFEDWKKLHAIPDRHWKAGFSAKTLARSWEDAKGVGFPPEIAALLATANRTDWNELKLLLAIPEYQVPLPGGSRPSQTDLVAFARGAKGLVAIAVEGKVDERFGESVGEKAKESSSGVQTRLAYLCERLGLEGRCPDNIRYQLLHRAVSALDIARDFFAESAVMIVHSFSHDEKGEDQKWFNDFAEFAKLFEKTVEVGKLISIGKREGVTLYVGWASGDQRFRIDLAASARP
jgi:hypothetical protein